ncbi:hypothetical protein [Litchfieldia alkalitelluris]|uniref:hypothetical protein n=1 Tax=Litchfieldia alkalitelluris TaxID=304268 RepID=UPI0009960C91|nr:hypothetical protein [Litchfieldia alkalitelluris]
MGGNGQVQGDNISSLISEKQLERFFYLSELEKQIDKEMKDLKKIFHQHFDQMVGNDQKSELIIGEYKIQRHIRVSEGYDNEKAVNRLEEKNLLDCIQVTRKPDVDKIEAAITLGLLDISEIEDCKQRKLAKAITVRKL